MTVPNRTSETPDIRFVTPKEEKLLHGILEGKTRRQAYIDAYDVKDAEGNFTMSLICISVKACETMKRPAVKARYMELLNMMAEEPLMTLQQHIQNLTSLRNRAANSGLIGSAIAAEIAMGKATGVAIDRSEVVHKSAALPVSVDEFC